MVDQPSFHFSTVVEALFAHADERPDALAYAVDDDRITFGALRDSALALAAALAARGVGRGDRCALVMGTAIDTVGAIYAVQIVGAAPIVIDPAQPAAGIHRRLRTVRPKLAICSDEAATESGGVPVVSLAEIRREGQPGWRPAALPGPGDTAYLQVTSGTAGEPKAAILSHKSLTACLRSAASHLEVRRDDVFVSWVPLHHDFGLVRFTFFPCFIGCPAYLIPPAVSNFERWLRLASEVSATITGGPDFGFRIASKLVNPGLIDLSALRYATNGGEPVRASTIRDFEQRFACPGVIRPGYGLAEATLGVSAVRPGQEVRVDGSGCVSCGQPFEGMAVAILAEDGRRCDPGEAGEIIARGDAIFGGYLDDPETTADVLRDGWLHTGDFGYLSDDGELFVLGRKRVLIKRAGAMVLPREIEEAVDRVEGVRFSAVIGHVRDDGSGNEEVVVVAEVRAEVAASDDHRSRISKDIGSTMVATVGFKPADVVLVEPRTIPRTRNGKIKHGELKRIYAEGRLGDDGAVLFSTRQ
jgi:acyl-CoA synthetase (AMP-forming)/AMP-acid ligase II